MLYAIFPAYPWSQKNAKQAPQIALLQLLNPFEVDKHRLLQTGSGGRVTFHPFLATIKIRFPSQIIISFGTNMDAQTRQSERITLKISTFGAMIIGIVGVTFSVLSSSQVILLDGLFNVVFFVTALFTLKVAGLLHRGEDNEFPLGYSFFEPLVNGIKGFLILGMSILAMCDALAAIWAGGRSVSAGLAVFYGLFAAIACWSIAMAMR